MLDTLEARRELALSGGMDALKRRLEVLIGEKPPAAEDESVQLTVSFPDASILDALAGVLGRPEARSTEPVPRVFLTKSCD